MSSGSTVLRFDFDIFSIGPISTVSPLSTLTARRPPAVRLEADLGRRDPLAGRVAIRLVDDHALGEQAGERLVEIEMAALAHRAGEEARIEQMQDRMLDAADILIDRQPVIGDRRIGRGRSVGRIGEAGEVPRRVDERVHRVGLAPRRPAALRTGDVLPGRMAIERIAGLIEGHVVGQLDRQILVGDGDDAAALAMDDRDRAAPVALTGDAPVAQLVVDLPLGLRTIADRHRLQPPRHLLLGRVDRHPVEEAGIDHARRRRRRRPCRR